MNERYAALAVMWLSLAGMVVGLAGTIGAEHVGTVLVLGLVGLPIVGLLSLGLIVHRRESGPRG